MKLNINNLGKFINIRRAKKSVQSKTKEIVQKKQCLQIETNFHLLSGEEYRSLLGFNKNGKVAKIISRILDRKGNVSTYEITDNIHRRRIMRRNNSNKLVTETFEITPEYASFSMDFKKP